MNDVRTVLLPAAIVEEWELIWVCCGWRVDLFCFHVVADVSMTTYMLEKFDLARIKASVSKQLRTAFFWVITKQAMAIIYRRFGKNLPVPNSRVKNSKRKTRNLVRSKHREERGRWKVSLACCLVQVAGGRAKYSHQCYLKGRSSERGKFLTGAGERNKLNHLIEQSKNRARNILQ